MTKQLYLDERGTVIGRRTNWSLQKSRILHALLDLERGAASPTAWDNKLELGFFDVATIARHIFGGSVFIDGKLDRNKRTGLNRSLNALYEDGFIDKVGNVYRGSVMRDFGVNNWKVSCVGKKMISESQKGSSRAWRREHRFYGTRGIKIDRAKVKRIAASDYAEDWD